jgi:hypothetical protein
MMATGRIRTAPGSLLLNLVAADVSPLHLSKAMSEPTHVGCYGSGHSSWERWRLAGEF